jgi:hypothetical protein
VFELVRWWNEDEREVHLVRVEREDGQRGEGPVQLRNRTDRREREQWTQFEVSVSRLSGEIENWMMLVTRPESRDLHPKTGPSPPRTQNVYTITTTTQ